MEFWKLPHPDAALAAVDARSGESWSYESLRRDSLRLSGIIKSFRNKSLGMLVVRNSYDSLVAYVAALNSGCASTLLDASLQKEVRHELLAAYRPDWVYATDEKRLEGYKENSSGVKGLWENESPDPVPVHPDLAVLLTTSGSTGSPKLVRLTLRNLAANADAIAQYLQLSAGDRPITSLPMSYSYGLSVINSHLAVGAAIVLTDESVLQKGFWEALDRHHCTSLAGVPYTYQMLLQTGLLKSRGVTLKTLTQAGGRLDERFIREMHAIALARGWKFFVMYGQTEATARISYVPFERLGEKIGSVGIAIPGGHLAVDGATNELVYQGPNVMMGYAESRSDLAMGDELAGVLRTGDTATVDSDGYFYITGRLKRFLKMFGKRLSLDDAERAIASKTGMTVACYGRDDLLTAAVADGAHSSTLQATICELFDLPRPAVRVVALAELPRTANGKLDYKRLADVGATQETSTDRAITA